MIAWTRQNELVLKEIESNGSFICREQFLRAKSDTISDYYIQSYRWLTDQAKQKIDIPEGLYLPIWLALTESARLPQAPREVSLTLDVPEENLFIIDYNKWGYVLNYMYVPTDDDDERAHDEKLRQAGIVNEASLIMSTKGNMFPQFKSEILRSWPRCCVPSDNMEDNVGCVWEVRKEWILEVEEFTEN
ncbi:MAG: DUF3841 domain-containing protein [Phoenicibacter congonensis]|uniref:DUF3841 domain-containing protein n=1 Tax=Phoenicibacter congonensis TaxID=1944646 RepID=A0AA43RI32_9ACTN|nr:DUF3841 domain-containing protein [Phoenicibacter congonensis]